MDKINRPDILKNFIIITALIIIPFILPYFHFNFDISTILTVISFLFTILVGFFIGATTTDYLRLQTLISNLDASLIEVFSLSKLIQPSSAKKITNVIDQYVIRILDYPLFEWFPNTKKEFDQLTKAIEQIDPTNKKGVALFPHLQRTKTDLERTNQEIFLATGKIVSSQHWAIIISLAIIIAILILSLRDGYWFFSLLNGIILVVIYWILRLLNEVDSNEFLAKKLAYQNPQQIFQAIGKLKYYPEMAIINKWAKEPQENYRIGVYKNYPHSFEKEIKIVKK